MQNKFIKILSMKKKDRPVLDLTMSTTELVMDLANKGDLLEAIPFANTVFKILKAKDSIADSIYANKLVGFIRGIGNLDENQKENLSNNLLKEDAAKIGETLLLVLDRINDLDKPELLGFLFSCFASGQLNSEQLRRLVVSVDVAFSDDLADFLELDGKSNEIEQQACLRRLLPSGLTYFDVRFEEKSGCSYHATELGMLFFKLKNFAVLNDALNGYKPERRAYKI